MRFRGRGWIPVSLVVASGLAWCAQELLVRLSSDQLRVSTPNLHLLEGRPLDRLHSGATVPFHFQLTLAADARENVLERVFDRFVFSYDLWEEKFSVVRTRGPRKSASHLTGGAAEAWCLENLLLSTKGLDAGRQFWVRLEIRSEEPKEDGRLIGEPGLSLTALIEIFSRPAHGKEPPLIYQAGPLRLRDLR